MTTVLIADDHDDVRLMIRMSITQPYRLLEAGNGEEALASIEAEQVDLMVLDIMMPVLDGFGVMERLGDQPAMPIVVVTGLATTDDEHVARLLSMGALDVISKPFDPTHLADLIDAMLRVDDTERQEYRRQRLARARGES